jgi:hypothetical protein
MIITHSGNKIQMSGKASNSQGVEKANFLRKKFNEAWENYDVNDEGVMDAMWASPFMRFLCKSEKDIDL